MKYNTHKPIYLQIAYQIVLDIYDKKIPLATLLPSVRELSVTYNVTPKTIQSVTKYLAENGIINKKPSVGSVITNVYDNVENLHRKHGINNSKEYIEFMKSLSYKNDEILQIVTYILGGNTNDKSN
jgi:GntR family transcriptional regulator